MDEEKESPQFGIYEEIKAVRVLSKIWKGGGNMNWIIKRLKEPSTWRGLVGIACTFGVAISPELTNQIIATGVAGIGLIEIIRKEKQEKDAKPKSQ